MATETATPSSRNLIMDIPVLLSVELGQAQLEVREMLALTSGSVIELNKSENDPVDLMVNGRLIARGQVVLVNDSLGVKIIEIINS
jgi:flagellar motor switch protein FliN/FliY